MSTPLLSGRQEYLQDETPALRREIERLVNELRRTEGELKQAQNEALAARQATGNLRRLLAPLWGEVQALGDDSPITTNLQGNSKWEAIKARNAGKAAEAIDVLLIHGSMNTNQLSAALKMGYESCRVNVVDKLRRQGLLVKNGRDLSLKELL